MVVGVLEVFLVLFVVLLLVGPRRIANPGRALGRGVRDFKLEIGRNRKDGELPEGERRPAQKR